MAVKDKLRRLRAAAFLSQAELAEKTGLAKATIARIEAGAVVPHGRTIRKLADVLGVKPAELIDPEELIEREKEAA